MKKEIKLSNPKFYLGHSTNPKYVEVECLFTYNNKLVWTLYLVDAKKGKKDEYYLAEAKKSYQQELASGELVKKARISTNPHYRRNRNLIIGGGAIVLVGLIVGTVFLVKHFNPPSFSFLPKADGTYELSEYRGNTKNVTIPETYNGAPVTSIASYTFAQHQEIESVVLSNNLITIGDKAFFGDSSLVSVTFSNTNASPSLTNINTHAFAECFALKDLYLPLSLHEIGGFAFQDARGLNDLFIPRNVRGIGADAFAGCSNLTFYLESKEIPTSWSSKWNSANRPYILEANRDTPSHMTIRDKIMYVKKIDEDNNPYAEIVKYDETEGELPETLTISTEVTLGNETLTVKSINENAFASTPKGKVRYVIIPEAITSVGSNAFKGLTNALIFVRYDNTSISSWPTNWNDGVLKTYPGFYEINTSPIDPSDETDYIKYAAFDGDNRVIIGGDFSTNHILSFANDARYIEIAPKAFAGNEDIHKININSQYLTTIGDYAFANCYNLTDLSFTNTHSGGITTIGSHAFYTTLYNSEHNGLTSIAINVKVGGGFADDAQLIIGDSAFEKGYKTSDPTICTEIQTLSIEGNKTKFGQAAFKGCQFKEGCSVTLDDDSPKPGRYCFNQSGENLTINVSNALFAKMQSDWGWPTLQDTDFNKLGLHETDVAGTYQLYSIVKPTKGDSYISYERFGQAKIVVGS